MPSPEELEQISKRLQQMATQAVDNNNKGITSLENSLNAMKLVPGLEDHVSEMEKLLKEIKSGADNIEAFEKEIKTGNNNV